MSVCFTLTEEQDGVKLRRSKINKLFIWGKRRHNPSSFHEETPALTSLSENLTQRQIILQQHQHLLTLQNKRATEDGPFAERNVAECPFFLAPPAGRVRPRPWEQQAIFWFVSLVSGASAAPCNLRIMWITYVTLWEGFGGVIRGRSDGFSSFRNIKSEVTLASTV